MRGPPLRATIHSSAPPGTASRGWTTSAWSAAGRWPTSAWPAPAVGTLRASGAPPRALSLLAISLRPHHDAPAADIRAVHASDHRCCISGCDLDERMALTQVDFSDPIRGDSSFAGDGAHQVPGLHTIASADGHEEAGHVAGSRAAPAPGRRRTRASRYCPRTGSRGLGRVATLRPLPLQ